MSEDNPFSRIFAVLIIIVTLASAIQVIKLVESELTTEKDLTPQQFNRALED